LYLADEVFLVGSAAEITPICQIDNYIVNNGDVGYWTKSLLKEYLDIVSNIDNRFAKWKTKVIN